MADNYHYDDEDLDEYPFFAGLTRQPQIGGVNLIAVVVEFEIIAILFLATANLLVIFAAIPLHTILYLMNSKDPDVFRNMYLMIITNGVAKREKEFHDMDSFSHVPPDRFDC
ncbi:VirB3 family type IV secretion system protein [Undibacterium sp. SXout7W]|uniref:VirB3 family type IV secretion system protein n=1 Tax=Undibacterium sp. SXout7W TaxID=3413049 RepID=UPI003BF168C4